MELYIGLQREESLHVIINSSTRARTKSKGGGFLVTRGSDFIVKNVCILKLSLIFIILMFQVRKMSLTKPSASKIPRIIEDDSEFSDMAQ